ncbi:hypothetical protein PV326_010292 [Microctonus aethiopoides]|nr:hypothetical protein PV326_010292 [Microctonus aethiopoides]
MMKVLLFISIVAIGSLCLLTIYLNLCLELWENSKLYFGINTITVSPQLNSSTKLILFWNTMFGDETFYFGHGDIFKNCPELNSGNNCYATHDRNIINIENYNAILFHGSELLINDLPNKRNKNQYYIFTNLESPVNRPLVDSLFENYFNLTMTYRLDSDIPWPYNVIRDRDSGNVVWPIHPDILWKMPLANATDKKQMSSREWIKDTEWIKGKTKTAVWFVSNCRSKSGREKYVEELEKYIDVDIYGRCGNKHCAKDEDCFGTIVEPNYYFYLSFENSLCEDYVTEKFYNAAKYNVVPVVYGGANYSLIAPPKSFINALDFESPQHLAKYLKMLTQHPDEYIKYFKWKEYYEVSNPNELAICRLCRLLHEKITVPKMYNSLSMWYNNDKCPLQYKLNFLPYITKLNANKN